MADWLKRSRSRIEPRFCISTWLIFQGGNLLILYELDEETSVRQRWKITEKETLSGVIPNFVNGIG